MLKVPMSVPETFSWVYQMESACENAFVFIFVHQDTNVYELIEDPILSHKGLEHTGYGDFFN